MGLVDDSVAELCEDDDSVSDSYGDTCSTWYNLYPSSCGTFDDDDFAAEDACCVCGGGSFNSLPSNDASPTPAGCVNDDSTGDRTGDTCSAFYDNYPSACGNWDTEDGSFIADVQCCACGGGLYGSEYEASEPVVCVSDNSTFDSTGDTCVFYDLMGGNMCEGTFDTADFSVQTQCCACGGGSYE